MDKIYSAIAWGFWFMLLWFVLSSCNQNPLWLESCMEFCHENNNIKFVYEIEQGYRCICGNGETKIIPWDRHQKDPSYTR